MNLGSVTPLFRIFDEKKAMEFYVEFLGFKVDWTHRFDSHSPLYMQLSLNRLTLHLTEHYGDCSPGSAIRVANDELDDYHKCLTEKNYKYLRPGIEITEWNTRELRLTDPFGNKIIFYKEL